jgi:hypothetical protein
MRRSPPKRAPNPSTPGRPRGAGARQAALRRIARGRACPEGHLTGHLPPGGRWSRGGRRGEVSSAGSTPSILSPPRFNPTWFTCGKR